MHLTRFPLSVPFLLQNPVGVPHLSCHVCVVPSGLSQSLSLSVSFMTLPVLRKTGWWFCRLSLCLVGVFSHEQTEAMYFQPEHSRGSVCALLGASEQTHDGIGMSGSWWWSVWSLGEATCWVSLLQSYCFSPLLINILGDILRPRKYILFLLKLLPSPQF